ncbi:hypothetical protein AMTR_s00097p00130540 [Amborella trichopoda]|uniref:Uncharacterized protein n=1 Tax=Amborella trichopoda TaxID=13333 RepID=W1P471_AMBTC|nr:hypothetical protein AMTR_s00097p00130540 [Amborella trichopoda]
MAGGVDIERCGRERTRLVAGQRQREREEAVEWAEEVAAIGSGRERESCKNRWSSKVAVKAVKDGGEMGKELQQQGGCD